MFKRVNLIKEEQRIQVEQARAESPPSESKRRVAAARREGKRDARRVGKRTLMAAHDSKTPDVKRTLTRGERQLLLCLWGGVASMLLYSMLMAVLFSAKGYTVADRIASVFMMVGIAFTLMLGFNFANVIIKSSWGYDEVKRRLFAPQNAPKVVCIVATFNEPADVLEETVAAVCALDYPNKEVIILDDSTKEEAREATRMLGQKYGAIVKQRTNRKGYKAGAINEFLPSTDAVYLAVFDADCLPVHNFLRDLIPMIDDNPRIAFIQTPQYYANPEVSPVAASSSCQQAVFYEYICEGKSYSRAAFCCGTNVIFRREALMDVGGFDGSSITEDFLTSFNLHLKAWDSIYYNKVYAYGMAPETLNAYFIQQRRWAFGTTGVMYKMWKTLFTNPRALRPGQWWEYLLSASYYWVGWINLVFMLLPVCCIFFGLKPLRQDLLSYVTVFVPYFAFTTNMFFWGMQRRGYKLGELLRAQQISFACFPILMGSAAAGTLGFKRPFGVTPKGESGRMSWLALWPHLLLMSLSLAAVPVGFARYFTGGEKDLMTVCINSFWALYNVAMLSGIFYLNRPPVHASQTKAYFNEGEERDWNTFKPGVKANAARRSPSFDLASATAGVAPRRRGVLRRTVPGGVPSAVPAHAGSSQPSWSLIGRLALGFNVVALLVIAAFDVKSMLELRRQNAVPENRPVTTVPASLNVDNQAQDAVGKTSKVSRPARAAGASRKEDGRSALNMARPQSGATSDVERKNRSVRQASRVIGSQNL